MIENNTLQTDSCDIEYIIQHWKNKLYLVHYRNTDISDNEWLTDGDIDQELLKSFNKLSTKEKKDLNTIRRITILG